MAKKEIEMWGLRFSQLCLMAHVRSDEDFANCCEKLSKDLWEMEDHPAIMETERKELGYCYLMFHAKEAASAFYAKHKDEEMYKWAHLRLIREPAYVPSDIVIEPKERGNHA